MTSSTDAPIVNEFGVVAEHGDSFEFHIDGAAGESCRLVAVVQTERGPRRTDLAEIEGATWRTISARVVRELAQDMGEAEVLGKKVPALKSGANRLSPLVGRELALLLWAIQEEGASEQLEALLHGWRELAREERWWLYAKAAAPGQRAGAGWRRGLFHALSELPESRSAAAPPEKKSPAAKTSTQSSTRRRPRSQPQSASPSVTLEPTPQLQHPQSPVRPVARRKKATAAATLK